MFWEQEANLKSLESLINQVLALENVAGIHIGILCFGEHISFNLSLQDVVDIGQVPLPTHQQPNIIMVRNIPFETLEILLQSKINILGVLSFECIPDGTHELHDPCHKLLAISFVVFDFLVKLSINSIYIGRMQVLLTLIRSMIWSAIRPAA